MSNEYTNNHYVPEWYQKRFIPSGQKSQELFYLNLEPKNFVDPRGIIHQRLPVKRQGCRLCFVEKDLYTTKLGSVESKNIEKIFFGEIDRRGREAINYFTDFMHPMPRGGHEAFEPMLRYMSTQKLRTPKGLDWISNQIGLKNKNAVLRFMLEFQALHCAIWTEAIWVIADASQSQTKFIVSDHPVTVYNRVCGPRSPRCRGSNDPAIWLNGTHTIFPLNLNKILILTNVSWVRDPYQSEVSLRPHPDPLRGAIFKFNEIQILRHLSEQEVIDINYVIKRRAYRYIAAAKEEWLYPERRISTTRWSEYGHGYMFMPDPRSVTLGGEVYIGHPNGTVSHFDVYGRRPWHPDYGKENNSPIEAHSLYRFKGEYAKLFGPYRRGRSFFATSLEQEKDDDEYHEYHLGLASKPRHRRKRRRRR